MARTRALTLGGCAALLFVAACHGTPPAPAESGPAPGSLAPLERSYEQLRYAYDQLDITRSRGADRSIHGVPFAQLVRNLAAAQTGFSAELDRTSEPADSADRQALEVMRETWTSTLNANPTEVDSGASDHPSCGYNPDSLAAGPDGLDRLTGRIFDCYGREARTVIFEHDTLDRLTVLGLLGQTADPERRRRLFLALAPVWRSVNGDDGPASPYRLLLRLRTARWSDTLHPMNLAATAFGLPPAEMERWLMGALEQWKAMTPGAEREPWDFYYEVGGASRALSPRIGLADLRAINDRYYRSLGADPAGLNVQFDLAPRTGKYAIAFTNFGGRSRFEQGAWQQGEPWVFASYPVGGLDNLAELLHESGHAIHIAAIKTRPALLDWPDSDTFTEALADIAGLELYEPRWQWRWLGDSVSLAESLRAKYGGIVMDLAWALFEIRVHRDPTADPNAVWTGITHDYLGVAPHPELSWWAMRGQLIESPGYLLNYAVGAFIIADIRTRLKQEHGDYALGDSTWYAWVSPRLYRFGLERSSRRVVEDFLGRAAGPDAMLEDMRRGMGPQH